MGKMKKHWIMWDHCNARASGQIWSLIFYLEETFTIFSKQHNQDVVTYNAIIFGYVQNNKGFSALHNHDVWYVHVF